jgi:hypothetical protein
MKLRGVFCKGVALLILPFCSWAATAGRSQVDNTVHTLLVEPGVRREIKLGSFAIVELDRDRYFRSYHMPGLFSEKRDRDLASIGATPGRGTGLYLSHDKQHTYDDPVGGRLGRSGGNEDRPQRVDFSGNDFQSLVKHETSKWSAVYQQAAARFPGLKHALALNAAFPEAMRCDGKRGILAPDRYAEFSSLVVNFFSELKSAGASLPAWFTTLNEPGSEWDGEEFAEYTSVMANAMAAQHPEVKVAGPCSAWPYPLSDWKRWDSFERPFIEKAGRDIGAYDLHLYSKGYWAYTDERLMGDPLYKKQDNPSLHISQRTGVGTVWDYGRADGLLDLFAAHHRRVWNEDPKPMIISEFGRQGIEPQLGPWPNDFKPWLYMTTVTRLWMTFMERPEVELVVPFITGESCRDYGAQRGQAIYNRPSGPEDTGVQPTRFREFYQFFRDLEGVRVRAQWSDRAEAGVHDIQSRAFLDGSTLYILLHNGNGYPGGNQTVKLDIATGHDAKGKEITIRQASIKRLLWEGPVPTDHTSPDLEGALRIDADYHPISPLAPIELAGEETALVRLQLSAAPVQRTVTESIDYANETLLEPGADSACTMTVELPPRDGRLVQADLRLSLARDGGFSENPIVKLNGKELPGVDVTFSRGIKDFHRPIEIALDPALLQSTNELQVIFDSADLRGGNPRMVTAKMVTSRLPAAVE